MQGVISPTDSRWRDDIAAFEEGDEETSEAAKNRIEGEQRRKRDLMDKGAFTWKPNFFELVDHPYMTADNQPIDTKEEKPHQWRLIQGEKGYWERRKRQDWSDMPYLWGPPEE